MLSVRDNIKIGEYRYDELNLQGYFVNNWDEANKKSVEIFFSKTMKMSLRDVGPKIVLDELDNSIINNVEVKIIEYVNNHYIAFFSKDDVNFDITMANCSQEELIELIESILK